jgi:hypothetical protein
MSSGQRIWLETAKAPDVQLVAVIAIVFAAMRVTWPFWVALGLLAIAAVIKGFRAALQVSVPGCGGNS